MTGVGGALAVVGLRHHEPADEILEVLAAGGGTRAEATLPAPGAPAAITRWFRRNGVPIGAGTVRSADQARGAVEAGARFLVTPTVALPVLEEAAGLSLPVVRGAIPSIHQHSRPSKAEQA